MPGCYAAVLTPYSKVRVDAGATPYSGDYLITKVVHRITPSLYTQEFEAQDRFGDRGLGRAGGRGAGRRPVDLRLRQRGDLLMADSMEHTVERLVERVGSTLLRQVPRHRHRRRRPGQSVPHPRHGAGRAGRARLGWALPASPFAGDGHGMVMLPKVGSGVWIEFEAGNLDIPIWSGCWWASGQRPDRKGRGVRVIVSEDGHKVILDDDADEVKLVHGGGPEITMTATEIVLTVGACEI